MLHKQMVKYLDLVMPLLFENKLVMPRPFGKQKYTVLKISVGRSVSRPLRFRSIT